DGLVLRLEHVTFSCDDPGRVSEFWAALLGYERAAAGSSWLATDPLRADVSLRFNQMAKTETIEVPIHLDINVPDREAALDRVLQLGDSPVVAKSFGIGELGDSTTIMRAPEGIGVCLEAPLKTARAHIEIVTLACAEPRELGRF